MTTDAATSLIGEALAFAVRLNAEGRLPQAALVCGRILKVQPNNFDALNLFGVVMCRGGKLAEGAELFRRALRIRPDNALTLDRLGDALYAQRNLDDALAVYRQALACDPNFVVVHCKIGIALQDQNRITEAIAAYREAIRLDPSLPRPYFNLGIALRRHGKPLEAAIAYARALVLKPDYPEAYLNLGNALMDLDRYADAQLAYCHAAAYQPSDNAPPPSPEFRAHAWTNIGIALRKQGRLDAALEAHRRALQLAPDYAIALNNLGVLLQDRGQYEEALAAHDRAVRIDPNFGTAHSNRGVAFKELGMIEQSIAAHRRAVAAEPDHPKIHFNLAAALLMAGNYEEGFAEYEWRWKGGVPSLKDRNFAKPQWDGSALGSRTLLLHAEQGFGDSVQFIRFARGIKKQNGKVIFEVPRTLVGLMQTAAGLDEVIAAGDPLPTFDVHLPLMSLPHVFGTRLHTVPSHVPYLTADPRLVAAWQQRLHSPALKIGVVWAGNPKHSHDHQRSIPVEQLVPALTMPGVQLFSLQKEPRPGDRETLAGMGETLIDLSPMLHDFNETAAAIMALDLVIAVDTSVGHLAGALGREVWTLLPFALDWRWLMEREDSVWYPTMRLYRQPQPGDWASVIARIQVKLTRRAMTADAGAPQRITA